jgi:hypothetical protein
MLDKIGKRTTENSVETSSSETMRTILKSVIRKREYLVGLSQRVDDEIKGWVCRAIPTNVLVKTSKAKIAELMVQVWDVMRVLLPLVRLRREEEHDLQSFLQLMDMIEKSCHRELAEARNIDLNAMTIRSTGEEKNRKYLGSSGFKVDGRRFPGCAMCGHRLIDHPFLNKEKAKNNAVLQAEWEENRCALESFLKGDGPAVVVDGKTVTSVPNPKFEQELIVCHCWQNDVSLFANGRVCALNCYDSKARIQYPAGKCPVCCCHCSFVCTKM